MNKNTYTKNSKIIDVIHDPAFQDFGYLLFPTYRKIHPHLTLKEVDELLVWYNHIDENKTVEIVNYLKDQVLQGKQIFYHFYSDEEIRQDPSKKHTGLFFFRGKEFEKTAIVNAGGGFMYVGAIHDSFPHCLELSYKGYNSFALIYRPDASLAMEDLARAIAFIYENQQQLKVSMKNYSLWGGSAGGRMVAWLASYGTESFIQKSYPRPATCIIQYTGLATVSGNEPPTYSNVGTSDWIASYQTMKNRIEKIKQNGTDTMIEVFKGLPHGFGLGTDTLADGWIDRAVAFWERNCK